MAAPTVGVTLPSRLGDPTMELRSDPREDPRMLAALAPFGLDTRADDLPIDRRSPLEELRTVASATEQAFDGVFAALLAGLPSPKAVDTRTLSITGVDGNDITLYVHRPIGVSAPLPGLRGRRRRIPELRRSPWPATVSGRPRRLRQRAGLDARSARRPRVDVDRRDG